MYLYNEQDQKIVDQRVEQFRGQTRRFLAGELDEEEFKQLRLRNGLYVQLHAPMLRVAIPYGLLSSEQLRMLAHIGRKYDKDYGHISTRQNIQFNWPALERVPDILAELATVQMHAIQTSGNCIRNVTTDHLAGVADDEIEDPRQYCEMVRQWSTLHPEFDWLPRKFKIAFSGATYDRAAVQVHDIGIYIVKNEQGETGFKIIVGGGLGRTPIIGVTIREFLEKKYLLSYLEAILRIYNLEGRRDNIYKARIKILVRALGIDVFKQKVEAEWARIKDAALLLDGETLTRIQQHFAPPVYDKNAAADVSFTRWLSNDKAFSTWVTRNVVKHKVDGYRIVYVSLKAPNAPPGDISSEQMDTVAALADQYSMGMIRTTHDQNLVLADVKQHDLYELWHVLDKHQLATPNIGTLNDMICCPGMDFCSLANAGSLSIARQINQCFDDLDYLYDLGDIKIKMSGCVNACGHHHVGHIGILGVDKNGAEFYQFTLGGSADNRISLGKRLGPAIAHAKVAQTIEDILLVYKNERFEGEVFLDTVQRIGIAPFKARVYGQPEVKPGSKSETKRKVESNASY
ncbi:MAG: nitrite/sulfite reductase [Gammaproteobacteria bacterium]|nr:nitrite/sulfite reductase [Gammaproteobacteria bacterium]